VGSTLLFCLPVRQSRHHEKKSCHQLITSIKIDFRMKIATALLCVTTTVQAFAPTRQSFLPRARTIQDAGGFEWEDPVVALELHVDNPFKNSELLNSSDGMKIDPARLLSPRLAGSNIYLIGMMGCGKSSVGDIVARRTFQCCVSFILKLLARETLLPVLTHSTFLIHRYGILQLFGY
jgi:hypothetical protein